MNMLTFLTMHGQKRSEYKSRLLNPEAASKMATKAQQWNALSQELLSQRRRLMDPAGEDVGDGSDANRPSPTILLALTEKMLTVNPDPSHLWNIRREILLYLIDNESTKFDVQPELSLTAHCLQRNPKAYSAWFHRKWSLGYMLSSRSGLAEEQNDQISVIKSELELCAQFLMLDERNFHCWNYRRFVVALLGANARITPDTSDTDDKNFDTKDTRETKTDLYNGAWSSWANLLNDEDATSGGVLMGAQIAPNFTTLDNGAPLSKAQVDDLIISEWEFTTSKIQDNFSNGSAFHYRSKLIPMVLSIRSYNSIDNGDTDSPAYLSNRQNTILDMAREEWEDILLNAIFTEPDDQTPWWYHNFIVAWAEPSSNLKDKLGEDFNELAENYESLLFDMADSLRELVEVEKENGAPGDVSEVAEFKGVKCKWAYLGLYLVLASLIKVQTGDGSAELLAEAQGCLEALIEVDPCRSERYRMLANDLCNH